MAVTGFSPSELDVTVHENTLLVTGKAQKEEEKKSGNGYLHRGIARRAFERRFSLADHMKVTGAKQASGRKYAAANRSTLNRQNLRATRRPAALGHRQH
jgi:molecular chaperone IbpA